MGMLNSIKDMFNNIIYDKEDDAPVEELKIKSEVRHVEIPSPVEDIEIEPKKVENVTNNISNNKRETKHSTNNPLFFPDFYFEEPKTKKVEPKEYGIKESTTLNIRKSEEKKKFTPSVPISPIFGVLNKNYEKDDIKEKVKPNSSYAMSSKPLTLDEVRNKALGNIDTFSTSSTSKNLEITEELEKIEPVTTNHSSLNLEDTLVSIMDKFEEENIKEDIKVVHEKKKITKNELYDLIDSMYEEEGEL